MARPSTDAEVMAELPMPAEVMAGRNSCEATCAYEHDGEAMRAYHCDSIFGWSASSLSTRSLKVEHKSESFTEKERVDNDARNGNQSLGRTRTNNTDAKTPDCLDRNFLSRAPFPQRQGCWGWLLRMSLDLPAAPTKILIYRWRIWPT